jgi:predicted enzyme related to lactoylglutathione lyase
MEKVTGIGGMFFRAKDPEALSAWYHEHLGVYPVPDNYEDGSWWQDEGPTVFAPFEQNTAYFGRSTQMWMINFRVRDMDAMVKQLEAAGISVKVDSEIHPNGRFAHLHDPEGNPIELWQAAGTDEVRPEGR